MIARIWHGYTTEADAEAYASSLKAELLPGITKVAGYKGSYLLRRRCGKEIEFITVMLWDSLEALREFPGQEKLKAFEYGLMVASASGAALIATAKKVVAGPQPTRRGDLLVFLSMFAAMVMVLLSKHLMAEYGALQFIAWMIGIGTLILLAWIEATHPMRFRFSLHIWLAVVAQGILCTTAAFLLWNWGLARVPASHAAIFLTLEPLVGTLLGVIILNERLGAVGIFGGALTLFSAA
jgi:drug/metabolite transporter (DMT)-like permease